MAQRVGSQTPDARRPWMRAAGIHSASIGWVGQDAAQRSQPPPFLGQGADMHDHDRAGNASPYLAAYPC